MKNGKGREGKKVIYASYDHRTIVVVKFLSKTFFKLHHIRR